MVIFGLRTATPEEFPLRESYPPDKFEKLREKLSRKFQVSKLLPRYFLDT